MTAAAAWAGIIVRDLEIATAWYRESLPVVAIEEGSGWVALTLDGGSCIELHAGDPAQPGLVFPSYGSSPGPPVLAGFGVDDPGEAATGLEVLRVFPDWVVVAVPDGLRVVLTDRQTDPGRGLVGFDFSSPEPEALGSFLRRVGLPGDVVAARRLHVVPVVAADRDGELVDPDGTVVRLRAR